MDFKQIESFIAVAETGSFTKAAKIMNVSQPSISLHVQNLESELKTSLLLRDTKKIKMTERGQEFYECAKNMLRLKDRMLRDWADEDKGLIRIGASSIPSSYILPEVLSTYQRLHPNIHVNIFQADSEKVVAGLHGGDYQIALVGMNVQDDDVNCMPFYYDRFVLITPATVTYKNLYETYKLTRQQDILVKILRERPVIFREEGSGSQKTTGRILRELHLLEDELNISARLNDTESIKKMVQGGLGVAILSGKAVENEATDGSVYAFELFFPEAERTLNVVSFKKDKLKKHEEDFIAFLKQYYEYTYKR